VNRFEGVGKVSDVITYPVKSLPGVRRSAVRITANGLEGDRLFALARRGVDQDGVSPKLTLRESPGLGAITPEYGDGCVILRKEGMNRPLALSTDSYRDKEVVIKSFRGVLPLLGIYAGKEAADWMAEAIGDEDVQVVAIPDDKNHWRSIGAGDQRQGAATRTGRGTDGYPVHYINLSSLSAFNDARAQQGLGRIGPERFRANVEINGSFEPFAENSWGGIAIGDVPVELMALGGCKRCVTIEVDQKKGERGNDVMKSLNALQGEMVFGTWASPSVSSVGQEIVVGQAVVPIV